MFGQQHRNIVLALYRNALRTALSQDSHTIHAVRQLFRKRRNVSNSLDVQKLLLQRQLPSKNNTVYNISEENAQNAEQPPPQPTINFNKKRRNPFFANFSDDEIVEFASTKTYPQQPQPLANPVVDARWYYNSKLDWNIKSKLNKSYTRNILPSIIQHSKQQYKLNKLANKLKQPTHKLRKINGTMIWMYVINTPWNTNLRFTNLKFIHSIRSQYDNIVLLKQLTANHKTKFNDPDFLDFDQYLKQEMDSILQKSIRFNKLQGLMYSKIKPQFDKLHKQSQLNLKLLENEIKITQTGPFTDILNNNNNNLTLMCRKYGFT